ncbi:MAG: DUF1329 domain-containing protein [Deltaproteobacteria bacterium]|nr:DUF1329 domain-containing protein [Deltaproteobacteria bacterium]
MKRSETLSFIILIVSALVFSLLRMPPAFAISDEESEIPGYYSIEALPEFYDFTGLWQEPPQSLANLTNGKITEGMVITKDNVEELKDDLIALTGENIYDMVKKGMEMVIAPYKPWPVPKSFMEVTISNKGRAVLDKNGNLRDKDGGWWTGGIPFFDLSKNDPQAGVKAWYNQINTFDGDDFTHDWVLMEYVNSAGDVERTISMSWDRLFLTTREILEPKPTYSPAFKDVFFKELVYGQDPDDLRGFGNLTYRYHDQAIPDDSFNYIPSIRRVRRLSSDQRFDAFMNCDATIGDFRTLDVPMSQWNWKVIEVKPKLTTLFSCDYITETHNTRRLNPSTVGRKFFRANWRLWPEVWVIEATPKTKKACSIYSKKIIWCLGGCWKSGFSQGFDDKGALWKTTQNYFYGYGDGTILDKGAHYETVYYNYDHLNDHASPWSIDFPHRKFNVGFQPDRFSTKYLQLRYGN